MMRNGWTVEVPVWRLIEALNANKVEMEKIRKEKEASGEPSREADTNYEQPWNWVSFLALTDAEIKNRQWVEMLSQFDPSTLMTLDAEDYAFFF